MAHRLSPSDPSAAAVGYVDDARKVDLKRFPTYKSGQTCANCMLVQLQYAPYRPCKLFPNYVVSEKGWCSAWVKKTYG
ncbi:MAG: high-potential iron-sulfur protein [Steroidobacteraceae bacterium]